jgi:hypothetical protein
MNTTPLSSRARITGLVAAAGVTALMSLLAATGSADAGGADRMTVTATATCNVDGTPRGVDLYYDDHADGHVPQSIEELVLRGSPEGGVEEWTGGGLYQEDGNYFNRRSFSDLGVAIDPSATYTYWVTISYDDGVTQTGSALIDLAGACAPAPAPPTPEPDRFQLIEGLYGCGTSNGGAFVEWSYGDYPDGHYAANFSLDLLRNGTVIEHHTTSGGDPTSDGAVTGFDVRPDGNPGAALDPFFDQVPLQPASYSLSITVTYEDGATDTHIVTFNLDDRCDGLVNGRTATVPTTTVAPTPAPSSPGTTTTTVPGGTLPETGSSSLTWVIGAVAGLLTTAGAALFAGVRRSRND